MLKREKLEEAGIDYETGLKRFVGQEELYEKYLKKFLLDNHYELACTVYQRKDYEELLKAIHPMKGMVGTLGMDELFAACCNVVDAIRANETGEIDALFCELTKQYQKMYELIQEIS